MITTKHATVPRDGFMVPLIGVPVDATLQECADCHDLFNLSQIELDERGFPKCPKCKTPTISRPTPFQ